MHFTKDNSFWTPTSYPHQGVDKLDTVVDELRSSSTRQCLETSVDSVTQLASNYSLAYNVFNTNCFVFDTYTSYMSHHKQIFNQLSENKIPLILQQTKTIELQQNIPSRIKSYP